MSSPQETEAKRPGGDVADSSTAPASGLTSPSAADAEQTRTRRWRGLDAAVPVAVPGAASSLRQPTATATRLPLTSAYAPASIPSLGAAGDVDDILSPPAVAVRSPHDYAAASGVAQYSLPTGASALGGAAATASAAAPYASAHADGADAGSLETVPPRFGASLLSAPSGLHILPPGTATFAPGDSLTAALPFDFAPAHSPSSATTQAGQVVQAPGSLSGGSTGGVPDAQLLLDGDGDLPTDSAIARSHALYALARMAQLPVPCCGKLPHRAQHDRALGRAMRCRNPLWALLFLATCAAVPIAYASERMAAYDTDMLAFFLPHIIFGALASAAVLVAWIARPHIVAYTVMPAGIIALTLFALATAMSAPPATSSYITMAALVAVGAGALLTSRRQQHAESVGALTALASDVLHANPVLLLTVVLALLIALLWMAPFGFLLISLVLHLGLWDVRVWYGFFALYWVAQTVRYGIHATAAGVATGWYYCDTPGARVMMSDGDADGDDLAALAASATVAAPDTSSVLPGGGSLDAKSPGTTTLARHGSQSSFLDEAASAAAINADPVLVAIAADFASPRRRKFVPLTVMLRALTLSLGAIASGALFVGPVRWLWLGSRMMVRSRRLMRVCGGAVRAIHGIAERLQFRFNKYAFRHAIVYGADFATSSMVTYRNFRVRGVAAIVEADRTETFLGFVPLVAGSLAGLFGACLAAISTEHVQVGFIILTFVIVSLIASLVMEVLEAAIIAVYACFSECPAVMRDSYPVLFGRFVRISEYAMYQDQQIMDEAAA